MRPVNARHRNTEMVALAAFESTRVSQTHPCTEASEQTREHVRMQGKWLQPLYAERLPYATNLCLAHALGMRVEAWRLVPFSYCLLAICSILLPDRRPSMSLYTKIEATHRQVQAYRLQVHANRNSIVWFVKGL